MTISLTWCADFSAKEVFRVLYQAALVRATQAGVISFGDEALLRTFLRVVEQNFVKNAESMIQTSMTSAKLHEHKLMEHGAEWRTIHSTSTCFVCLRHRPLHKLKCGHIICANCVQILGDCSQQDDRDYFVRRCFLCQSKLPGNLCIKIHPPTAGVGVVCIDGGGVRGVIPLRMMKKIQDTIDLPIPFQRFVKVAFGISSGT